MIDFVGQTKKIIDTELRQMHTCLLGTVTQTDPLKIKPWGKRRTTAGVDIEYPTLENVRQFGVFTADPNTKPTLAVNDIVVVLFMENMPYSASDTRHHDINSGICFKVIQ